MPAVSVIMPARDAASTLPAALDALAALEAVPGGMEVILADDGSSDATREIAAGHPVVTRVVGTPGGLGPGAARNAAAAASSGEILAFTDADCVPDARWLTAVLAAMAGGADVVQGRVEPLRETGPFDRTVRVPAETGLYETANLSVRREWFERVGGFVPWLHPRRSKELAEDVWLGWRLRRAGANVVFAPDALVRHEVFDGTIGSFVAQHARLRFFPQMVARIPELRSSLLRRGVFLNQRTAAFDLAVAAIVAAILLSPIALVAILPYARHVWRAARPSGRRAPEVAFARIAADAVGFCALITGNLKARTLVL